DEHRPPRAHERQHHQRGQDGAENQVQVDLVEGRVDVPRLVADDLELDVGRHLRGEPRELRLHALDHRHGVLAGLAAHLHDDGGRAVHAGRRSLLLGDVLGVADVADADRPTAEVGHYQVVEGAGLRDTAHRPERRLVEPGGDVAPRQVGVLAHDGIAHVDDRDLIGGQPVRIDPDVDGPQQAADDPHLADAGRALQHRAHGLVGELGQLAERALAPTGAWSLSNFETTGGRLSLGMLRMAMATLSRTSWAATSIWRFRLNVTMTIAAPLPEIERSSLMPWMVLICSSSRWATWVSSSSVEAPGSSTRTLTVGRSTAGKRSTPSLNQLAAPTTTNAMMSMVANTGRLMQTSASFCMRARAWP